MGDLDDPAPGDWGGTGAWLRLGRPETKPGGTLGDGTGLRFSEGLGSAGGAGGLKSSSRGGTIVGCGIPLGLGTVFALEPATSGRRDSSSLRSCRSYMIDERLYSISAAVISSVTLRLWVCSARCRFWEIPSARRTSICSYLFAC